MCTTKETGCATDVTVYVSDLVLGVERVPEERECVRESVDVSVRERERECECVRESVCEREGSVDE